MKKYLVIVMVLFLVSSFVVFAGGKKETAPQHAEAKSEMAAEVAKKPGIVFTPYGTEEGMVPTEYREAPILKKLVDAGKIPPVEQRLPKEPLVVKPTESIGNYGGELVLIQRGIDDWELPSSITLEPLLGRAQEDGTKVIPNVARDWELAPDNLSLTLYLREGLKWSDGKPFTADDILFWYNDIFLIEELTPEAEVWGDLAGVEKIDDYTVKFNFLAQYPGAVFALSEYAHLGIQGAGESDPGTGIFDPAHYLKQFHIKYNPDADKLAKDAGFDNWYELFHQKAQFSRYTQTNPDLPVLGAWRVKTVAPDHVIYERNPFYWKVDTEGNQLPYIDRTKGILAEDDELRAAKIMAGEPDFSRGDVGIPKMPAIKLNQEKNKYRVELNPAYWDWYPEVMVLFNHTTEDPVIRELLNNVKFKQALSLAIDRDEINTAALIGTGEPTQAVFPPDPANPLHDEQLAKKFIDYDPERAMRLLDEIGLKKDKEGFRLRSDGELLRLVLDGAPWIPSHPMAGELIADYWNKIGIKTTANMQAGDAMFERFFANESHANIWVWDENRYTDVMEMQPWWTTFFFWGYKWFEWVSSDGKEGTEPPAAEREFFEIWADFRHIPDETKRLETGRRAMQLLSENLWFIGVVTPAPIIAIARNSLKNVNLESDAYQPIMVSRASQWYWE